MALADIPLRAYFAAHAPEVPAWFEHVTVEPPAVPDAKDFIKRALKHTLFSVAELELLRDWLNGAPVFLVRPELEQFGREVQAKIAEAKVARAAVAAQNDVDRWFAWRWHYADRMLADMAEAQG